MAASDFTAVNLASIGSIDLISIGSIGSIDLASETDLNIVGSTAVGTERRTIVDRSRPPAGFQKPAGRPRSAMRRMRSRRGDAITWHRAPAW
jgi:hypothetical protein